MKRLLLVHDHNLFRQILALILEQHTDLKENIQAGSLAEAHQLLDDLDRQLDLAVVDLDLPEGDATELIDDLRELDIPVLAFTASLRSERRASGLRAGASEVLATATSGEKIVDTAKLLISG
jgi:DNA-binding NarL/FixJ family response regulator